MEEINSRIKQEICYETLKQLSDSVLINEYKECKSVKRKISILETILDKYVDEEKKQRIILFTISSGV